MVCYFHRNVQAVGVCTQCGRGMCFDCATVGYYRGLCPVCGQDGIKKGLKKARNRTIGAFFVTAILMAILACVDIFFLKKLDMMTDIIIAGGVTLAITLIFALSSIKVRERKMFKRMKTLVVSEKVKRTKASTRVSDTAIKSNRVDVDNSNPKAESKK